MKDRKKIIKLAKTMFAQSVKTDSIAETLRSVKFVSELFRKNAEIPHFFNDIFQSEENHRKVLQTIIDKGAVDSITTAYLWYLLEARGMSDFPHISEHFQRLADAHLGQARAVVSSPVTLSAKDRDKLVAVLSSITHKKISLREQIDPSLIAGISVRIGSTIYDGSLANQLSKLEKEIRNAS